MEMISQFSAMETKSNRRHRPIPPLPEGFTLDPTLEGRYPDSLFAEKHAQAVEDIKKYGLPENSSRAVPSPSMQEKFEEGEALLRETGLLPLK